MKTTSRSRTVTDVGLLYYQALAVVRVLALIRAADAVLVTRAESTSEETTMLRLTEWAMLHYVAVRAACLLDNPDPGIVCLPKIFDALSDSAARAAILDYPTSFSSRQEREGHLDKAYQSWERVSVDPRRELLRKATSHTLVHNLTDKTMKDVLDRAVLTFQDLADYAEECASIVGELAWACLGTSEVDAVRSAGPGAAERIWQRMSSIP